MDGEKDQRLCTLILLKNNGIKHSSRLDKTNPLSNSFLEETSPLSPV